MSLPSPLLCALVLLALPFLLEAQVTPAASPEPAANPDPVAILEGGRQYSKLLKLLKDKHLVDGIANQLQISPDGLTIFAPTDKAFNKLPTGALNKLSSEEQTQLLMLHVVGRYYSFELLPTASNPVQTLASLYTLNITSGNNQANVSTGAVNTPVNTGLYDKFPLAIFPIDAVLIPTELVGGKAPAPGAPSPASLSASASCRGRRVAWGVFLGTGLAFLGLLR
ncbi:unnamed protein product [Spirodela intermedia]|uniref:FAS1 domain-containing protein n=1 Tax=Spirodela intermedia TaxID=51605 RepID=A0A7I8LLN9_SPIIN|nr:unnamed protein product [Spirodela intermedia]